MCVSVEREIVLEDYKHKPTKKSIILDICWIEKRAFLMFSYFPVLSLWKSIYIFFCRISLDSLSWFSMVDGPKIMESLDWRFGGCRLWRFKDRKLDCEIFRFLSTCELILFCVQRIIRKPDRGNGFHFNAFSTQTLTKD